MFGFSTNKRLKMYGYLEGGRNVFHVKNVRIALIKSKDQG